jgi:hypothetical protein
MTLLPALLSLVASVACGSGTSADDPEVQGSYSVDLTPPLLVEDAGTCNRFISYAILSMGSDGGFSLSINVMDDCRNQGGQFEFFEVYNDGSYTRNADTLNFVVGTGANPGERFTGRLEGEYIRVVLPEPYGGIATQDVELRLGPRVPF